MQAALWNTEKGGTGVQIKGPTSLAVSLPHELCWLACIASLELTGRHDDWVDVHRLERESDLEGLALTLATPDSQNQGHLDLVEGLVEVVL